MSRSTTLLALILTTASSSIAWSQTKPSAFVYVSSNYSGNDNQTVAFVANANGQLTPVPGSPFDNNITSMAVNGQYLFGSDNVPGDGGRNIYSYRITGNGALHYLGATNIHQPDGAKTTACNVGETVTLDHTGSYLYAFVHEADCDADDVYDSFVVNQKTGMLTYAGQTVPETNFLMPDQFVFSTNNLFAYTAGGSGMYTTVTGFQKGANGVLTRSNFSGAPYPAGQPSEDNAYVGFAAADTTNHLAVIYDYSNANTGASVNKIATFAINTTTGALTTSSTYSNMPATLVSTVNTTAMAPSGKLLAVGGANGLQIFHFNPSGQATAATQLITPNPITSMYWNNKNHLYAISNADSNIHVFTITPTSAEEVPGSPYTVIHPAAMIVQPM